MLFFQFLIFGLMAGMLPSPHNIQLISWSLEKAPKKALLSFIVGAFIYDLVLLFVFTFFLHAVVIPRVVVNILHLLASLYLAFIIYKLLNPQKEHKRLTPQKTYKSSLVKGFLIQSINPNPLYFWGLIAVPLFIKEIQRGSTVYSLLPHAGIFFLITYGIKTFYSLRLQRISLGFKAVFYKVLASVCLYLVIVNIRNISFFE